MQESLKASHGKAVRCRGIRDRWTLGKRVERVAVIAMINALLGNRKCRFIAIIRDGVKKHEKEEKKTKGRKNKRNGGRVSCAARSRYYF